MDAGSNSTGMKPRGTVRKFGISRNYTFLAVKMRLYRNKKGESQNGKKRGDDG